MGKYGKHKLPEFVLKTLGNQVVEEDSRDDELDRESDVSAELDHPKNVNDSMKKSDIRTEGHVHESFQAFVEEQEVNEEDLVLQPPTEMAQPCEGCSDHPDTLSEKAKSAIKNMCDSVLIHEAQLCESSEDPNQTYESFLRECTHYMAECLIRAAQNLKV